jgi:hypothetical protein
MAKRTFERGGLQMLNGHREMCGTAIPEDVRALSYHNQSSGENRTDAVREMPKNLPSRVQQGILVIWPSDLNLLAAFDANEGCFECGLNYHSSRV